MADHGATTSDISFLRVIHLNNSKGSLYLNDLDADNQQSNQHFHITTYVPYDGVVDIPLTDAVLLSYHRGSVRNLINRDLAEAYILYNNTVVEVVDSPTTISPGQNIILVDTSQGDVTVDLPALSAIGTGNEYIVKKITPDANSVHLEAHDNDSLENDSVAFSMDDPFGSITLRSSDSGWWFTAQYPSGEGGGTGGGTGGDGEGILFNDEYVVISDPSVKNFTLTEDPHANSEGVYWNGMHLSEGGDYDYTISGQTVTLNASLPLTVGDTVAFQYAYGGTGGGGTGTGTAGRRDYIFANNIAVPENSGILYLEADSLATSSVPLVINKDSVFSGASIRVNTTDATNAYDLEVLTNGVVTETLRLAAGTEVATDSGFTNAITAGDSIALRIVRVVGSGKSAFNKIRVTLEIAEQ